MCMETFKNDISPNKAYVSMALESVAKTVMLCQIFN